MRGNWCRFSAGALFFLVLGCGEKSAPDASCPGDDATLDGDGQAMVALAVGPTSACAIADDGTLLCWGDLPTSVWATPEPIPGVSKATSVVLGSPRSCAIRSGGSVICWTEYDDPAVVPNLCGATSLALSVETRCAVSEGRVRCWGASPVAVAGVSGATAVAAGFSGYTCALISDGSVTCWGGGPRGSDRPGPDPAPVPEIADAVQLVGSDEANQDMCAVLADGSVTCWTRASAPLRVPSIENVVSLAHGAAHDCAVINDGSVRCWGQNASGELGNGTEESSDSAVLVEGLSGATHVAVGGFRGGRGTSCALLDDGSVHCWGSNSSGQFGTGLPGDSSTPVEVEFP